MDRTDLRTDMLQHLNANESIKGVRELCWDIPVVHQVDTDTSFQSCRLDSFFGKGFLFD